MELTKRFGAEVARQTDGVLSRVRRSTLQHRLVASQESPVRGVTEIYDRIAFATD